MPGITQLLRAWKCSPQEGAQGSVGGDVLSLTFWGWLQGPDVDPLSRAAHGAQEAVREPRPPAFLDCWHPKLKHCGNHSAPRSVARAGRSLPGIGQEALPLTPSPGRFLQMSPAWRGVNCMQRKSCRQGSSAQFQTMERSPSVGFMGRKRETCATEKLFSQ